MLAGFGGSKCGPSEKQDAEWDKQFAALAAFVTNHSRLPTGREPGHEALGRWVWTQRHSKSVGTLEDARGLRLEGLRGWSWSAFSTWEEQFAALVAFEAVHNRLPRQRGEPSHEALGRWVETQRRSKSVGTLEEARRLRAAGGGAWLALECT